MKVAAACLVLLVLVAGAAQAAATRAEVRSPHPLRATGSLVLAAPVGALDLAPALRDGVDVVLAWDAAEGSLLTSTRDYYAGAAYVEDERGNASLTWGAGTLRLHGCAEGCKALLYALPGGSVGLEGAVDGPLLPAGSPVTYWTGSATAGAPDAFLYEVGETWLDAGAGAAPGGTRVQGAIARATGPFGLMAWGVRVDASHDGRNESLQTGTTREPFTGPGGVPLGERSVRRSLVLEVTQGALEVPAGASLRLLASAPALRLSGALDAREADGWVEVDGRRRALEGDDVTLHGDVEASLAFAAGALLAEPGASDARVAGDAVVLVNGAGTPTAQVPRAAAGVGLLGLLLAALFLLKPGLVGAYTRLQRASVLRNPNRTRLYEAIRATPGAHMLELARITGMAEGVVRHHLGILVQHSFIVERGEGRVRSYFLIDGTVDRAGQDLLVALKDETRRRIATEVASAARPLSQTEVAQRVGVSVRLASYHLGRLERAGLVLSHGSMPQRYSPTPALASHARDVAGSAA